MPIPKLYYFPDGTIRNEVDAGADVAGMSEDMQLAKGIERARTMELEQWLSNQSMDTKLLFVMNVNWDVHDGIVIKMLDDPKLDRSIAAWVFWNNGMRELPYLEPGTGGTAARILDNLARGFYESSELEMSRCEILEPVQEYIALIKSGAECPPVSIPAALVYPFEGRAPVATPPIDQKTREELEDIFNGDSLFEFSVAERKEGRFHYWAERKGFLPAIGQKDLAKFETSVGIDYLEAVFGNNAAYAAARKTALNQGVRKYQAKTDADRLRKSANGLESVPERPKINLWALIWFIAGSVALILLGFFGHRLRTGQW